MSFETIGVFSLAAVALLLIPGPAVTYIVTRSIEGGRRAGLLSVAGVHVGTSVHVLAATVGLSGILMTSALAFSAIKYAGAAYLVYVGVRALLSHPEVPVAVAVSRSSRRVFVDAAIINVLNPKVALFFLAFLPQFVDPARGPIPLQLLALGVIYTALGLVTDSGYALFASSAATRLRDSATFARLRTRVAGVIYIVLGASAALTGSRSQS